MLVVIVFQEEVFVCDMERSDMICLTPLSIEVPKGSKHYIAVPCGKCANCLKTRVNEWTFRLKQELKVSNNAFFITLTYSDDCLPRSRSGVPVVNKKDVQNFFKRLRKNEAQKIEGQGYKIRYFLVSEYGGHTGRPHYHAILFNLPVDSGYKGDKQAVEMIHKAWKYGAVYIGNVTDKSIAYCAHYSTAWHYDSEKANRVRPFMLSSRKPPIGDAYLHSKHADWLKDNYCLYDVDDCHVISVPRYYRRKIAGNDKVMAEAFNNMRSSLVAKYIKEKYGEKIDLDEQTFAARLQAADENLKRFIKTKKQHI